MDAERVGSLPEEAAKLVAVLQGWAGDNVPPPHTGGESDPAAFDDSAGEGDSGSESPPGHDPLSSECRYCLWCQAIRTAKGTSPEVREHLTNAATSFALAVQSLLETPSTEATARSRSESPIEKIDLAED